jgi:enoyl-CoA hydratase/carnithine racemase
MSEIAVSQDAGIGRIRIDRPAKKNALTVGMYATMADALDSFAAGDGVRAVVISGGADFTAGNDLNDFATASLGGASFHDLPVVRFLHALRDFPKPVVMSVRGNAVGIGTTMLLHADVAVASESARFRLPFVPLGLVPEAGSSLLLPLTVGLMRSNWLLLAGDFFSAAEAHAMGLLTRVVADEETDRKAEELAARLAAQPATAVRETKRLMKAPFHQQLAHQMNEEVDAFAERLASDEFRAAVMKLLAR